MKIRTRNDFIRDFIVGELTKRGMTIGDIAKHVGKGQSTVTACIRGVTTTPSIRKHIISVIGANPWKKYPEQAYIPPEEGHNQGG